MGKKNKDKNKDKERDLLDDGRLDFSDEVKRLNRVMGQIEGIQKMLKAGRKLDDVITQCKAVHSAIASVEQRVFKVHLDAALHHVVKLDKKKHREEVVEELEALFKKAV
jgi:DNA-binding FrmR family transcriptional regulator